MAELLSELSKSSKLQSPPDDIEDTASLSSSSSLEDAKTGFNFCLQFILAAFVPSLVVLLRSFCCLCGTPSSFIPPHTCFTVGFPSC
jgi:hypothetical protein